MRAPLLVSSWLTSQMSRTILRSIGAGDEVGRLGDVVGEHRDAVADLHRLDGGVGRVGAQHDRRAALDHLAPRLHRRQAVQRGVVDDVMLAQVVEPLRQAVRSM